MGLNESEEKGKVRKTLSTVAVFFFFLLVHACELVPCMMFNCTVGFTSVNTADVKSVVPYLSV